jgi:outer membrane protein insertion porin family
VTVVENPVIGRVAFEGNKKVKDEQLSAEIQSKPRGTLSRPMVQSDAQRIAEIYRRSGRYDVRVNPEIIEQPNNRVDLVFTITEGSRPASSRSSSSATAPIRRTASRTSSRPTNRIC